MAWLQKLFAFLKAMFSWLNPILPPAPLELPVDKKTIQAIVDTLFVLLEKRFAEYPLSLYALEILQNIADALIDKLVAKVASAKVGAPAGGLTIKDIVHALFALLESKLVYRPILLMMVEGLRHIADELLDQIDVPLPGPTPEPPLPLPAAA